MKPGFLLASSMFVTASRGHRDGVTKSPDIQKIAFTGSTQIGKPSRRLPGHDEALDAGARGKSPNIILDDGRSLHGDPDGHQRRYLNNGQACIAASRLIVRKTDSTK